MSKLLKGFPFIFILNIFALGLHVLCKKCVYKLFSFIVRKFNGGEQKDRSIGREKKEGILINIFAESYQKFDILTTIGGRLRSHLVPSGPIGTRKEKKMSV